MNESNRFLWHAQHEAAGMEGMDIMVDEEFLNFEAVEAEDVITQELAEITGGAEAIQK